MKPKLRLRITVEGFYYVELPTNGERTISYPTSGLAIKHAGRKWWWYL